MAYFLCLEIFSNGVNIHLAFNKLKGSFAQDVERLDGGFAILLLPCG